MGFDVKGKNDAFHHNVWWWHPLWDFVITVADAKLTEEQKKGGHYNDGIEISAEQAREISDVLDKLIAEGKVKQYEKGYAAAHDAMPDEICELCKGTGVRTDKLVEELYKKASTEQRSKFKRRKFKRRSDGTLTMSCNSCEGKGKVRPFATWYSFSEENVKEFSEFARASGGFEIF